MNSSLVILVVHRSHGILLQMLASLLVLQQGLPVNPDYTYKNVQTQTAAANSHLKIFKRLTKLKKNNVLRQGEYLGALTNNDNVFVYKRWYGTDIAVVVLNYGSAEETVDVKAAFTDITEYFLPVYAASLETSFVVG